MKFIPTPLAGLFVIELEKKEDERGFFARTWCAEEFEPMEIAQCSVSFNKKKRTLRGMHYQAAPHEEKKVVRCTRGAIFDVSIDLRPKSPTFKQWYGTLLLDEGNRMLYITEGFAHGFQTLTDDTEVSYLISTPFAQDSACGVRWNDPAFDIQWPFDNPILSEKDKSWKDFTCGGS